MNEFLVGSIIFVSQIQK